MNNAKEIEKLISATVKQQTAKSARYFGSSESTPLPAPENVADRIVKAQEKIQPGIAESGGKGWTAPLNQNGALETWDPMLHVDTTGLLTFVIRPLKTAKFKTSDATPIPVQFNFTEPPRP